MIISLVRRDDPFGVSGAFKDTLAEELRTFEIQMGYMEVINVEKIPGKQELMKEQYSMASKTSPRKTSSGGCSQL